MLGPPPTAPGPARRGAGSRPRAGTTRERRRALPAVINRRRLDRSDLPLMTSVVFVREDGAPLDPDRITHIFGLTVVPRIHSTTQSWRSAVRAAAAIGTGTAGGSGTPVASQQGAAHFDLG